MPKKNRSKKRTRSQLIGEAGEAVFKRWAIKRRLSPTKPEVDYGIDYVCTVFQGDPRGDQLISGPLLAVQVRSTDAKPGKQRVSLGREDAETALHVDGPFLLVGVDLTTDQVYFRFIDEAFIAELKAFLDGKNESISWSLKSFDSADDTFFKRLDEVCRPAYQQSLRWIRAKLDVVSVARGSKVRFTQNDHGGIALVHLPLITAAFEVVSSKQREAARIVFEEGRIPDDATLFPPHPAIRSLADLVNGSVVITGPLEREVILAITAKGANSISIPAAVRTVGDETAFVLQSGLYLAFSAARRKGKETVHEFEHGIGTKGARAIVDLPKELEFLKALREGAEIRSDDGLPFPISYWGNLKYLGPDVEQAEKALHHLAVPWGTLTLAEIVQQNFLIAIGIVNAFLDKVDISRILPGFIYEQPLAGGSPKEENWRQCKFAVPVVMNLGQQGIVIWSTGSGSVYLHDTVICGFRAEKLEKWSFEKTTMFPQLSAPELWLCKDWPGIPLGATGPIALTKQHSDLPLSGIVELV